MAIETEMVPTDYNAIFEEREPEIFRPEIKRPEGDYFHSEDLISFLNSSPAGLVEILRRYHNTIKIYCILSNDRKFFYDESIDPMDCLYILSDAKFHYLEVRRLYDEIIKERIVLNSSAMKEAASLIGDAAPLVAEAAILSMDKEALQKEIASLKAELAALKSELTVAKESNTSPVCDGKGTPAMVCRMRREGKKEREIAEILYGNGGKHFSHAQVGALLHPDESVTKADSKRLAALNLLKNPA